MYPDPDPIYYGCGIRAHLWCTVYYTLLKYKKPAFGLMTSFFRNGVRWVELSGFDVFLENDSMILRQIFFGV